MEKREKKKLVRIMWLLYGIFTVIMLLLIALFMMDFIDTADNHNLDKFKEKQRSLDLVTVCSTDLKNADNEYDFNIPIYGSTDSSILLNARVNEYDISIASTDESKLDSPYATAAIVFQSISVIVTILIPIFIFILLYLFYKSIRKDRLFSKKNIRWLTVVGIAVIVKALAMDFSIYFETQYVLQYLTDTSVNINGRFHIHYVNILFGLFLIFIAEIFKIASDIQKEQDLTI
ncbi:MAG: DUF2975 domain-containing protein [Bacteroidales bacterium]|nr:DUF2975 domain-containing protein [Bacteroidales bacterium]